MNPGNASVSRSNQHLTGTVIKIVDGDTFDVLTAGNNRIRIRLYGIDSPERSQDHYRVCKNALGQFIAGRLVRLVPHGKDRNKRLIAEVFLNGENINLKMINNGYAWHFKKYAPDALYAKAEISARSAKRGLWQMAGAVAPWDFRKMKKKKSNQ